MHNMSYCRFSNTLGALRECLNDLGEMSDPLEDLSEEEAKAFKKLVVLGRQLGEDYNEIVEE